MCTWHIHRGLHTQLPIGYTNITTLTSRIRQLPQSICHFQVIQVSHDGIYTDMIYLDQLSCHCISVFIVITPFY